MTAQKNTQAASSCVQREGHEAEENCKEGRHAVFSVDSFGGKAHFKAREMTLHKRFMASARSIPRPRPFWLLKSRPIRAIGQNKKPDAFNARPFVNPSWNQFNFLLERVAH